MPLDIQQEIIRITSEYLEDDLDYYKLSQATKEYKALLNNLCGLNLDVEVGRSDLMFDNGKALGTFWASLCIDEMIRTRQFVRGIDKAIQEHVKVKTPLHILYAGTGPYAALILPIIFRYSKHDIAYTFMEINPFSFQILQDMIPKLGLEDYKIKLIKDDATTHKIDPENKPHIIISETMQNLLAKEQQVPIFLNLMNQVKYDSIFIPEKIELFIGVKEEGIPAEHTQNHHYQKIEKILNISREIMNTENCNGNSIFDGSSFKKKKTVIEEHALRGFSEIVLMTEIQVYKDSRITVNECGLTTPLRIKDIPNKQTHPIVINTQYIISSKPELKYEILDFN